MSGVPVVATRCGGPEWIVTKGDGYLVAAEDPEDLSVALSKMIHSKANFEPKAMAERAKSRFSENAVAKQLTPIYEDVKINDSLT
jgi:glycosyltransferase involved in cell wall biosynthesis